MKKFMRWAIYKLAEARYTTSSYRFVRSRSLLCVYNNTTYNICQVFFHKKVKNFLCIMRIINFVNQILHSKTCKNGGNSTFFDVMGSKK